MLTIFSIPKPFKGHIEIIQKNALTSWSYLDSNYEIILCGDEQGTKEAAFEINAKYLPKIARNEYGTPLLSSAFSQVRQIAANRLLCYVNTDIILMSDFKKAINRIHLHNFLLAGQRWDVDITELWDFEQSNWEDKLRAYVADFGALGLSCGMDYFVFQRDNGLGELPPFAVGRPGWDNWFIYRARSIGLPVIDITKAVTAIHQNHDHTHILYRTNNTWEGPEANLNRKLMGGPRYSFSLLDVTSVLTRESLVPALGYRYLRRRLHTLPILLPKSREFVQFLNMIARSLRSLFSKKNHK